MYKQPSLYSCTRRIHIRFSVSRVARSSNGKSVTGGHCCSPPPFQSPPLLNSSEVKLWNQKTEVYSPVDHGLLWARTKEGGCLGECCDFRRSSLGLIQEGRTLEGGTLGTFLLRYRMSHRVLFLVWAKARRYNIDFSNADDPRIPLVVEMEADFHLALPTMMPSQRAVIPTRRVLVTSTVPVSSTMTADVEDNHI